MRTVVKTSEIAHLWAHQAQPKARNPQGNLFFNQGTIYSYRESFPIASHVINRKGESAVFITTDRYSVTTSGHIHAVRSAVPSSVMRFEFNLCRSMLPYDGHLSDSNAEKIIAEYQRKVRSIADDAIASRTAAKIARLLDEARAELAELQRFVTFFKLSALSPNARISSRKLPYIPESVERAKELGKAAKDEAARLAKIERERKAAEYAAKIAEWMTAHPDYAARWDGTTENAEALAREFREAERLALELFQLTQWFNEHPDATEWDGASLMMGKSIKAEWVAEDRRIRNAETLAAWLRGENVYTTGLYDLPTMLRIRGDEIETSRGVRFPVSHAKRGLALVRAVMARGEEWRANGHTCHLGHYCIDRITEHGTVHAGCHVVTWEAIQRIAEQLDAMSANDESEDN